MCDIIDTGSFEFQFATPTLTGQTTRSIDPVNVTPLAQLMSLVSGINPNCIAQFGIKLEITVQSGQLTFSVAGLPQTVSSFGTVTASIPQLNDAFANTAVWQSTGVSGSVFFRVNTTNGVNSLTINLVVLPSPPPSSSLSPPALPSPPSPPTTKPPLPTTPPPIGDVVKCVTASACVADVALSLKAQGITPCVDISKPCGGDTDCFSSSSSGSTSKCKAAADLLLVVTPKSSKQDQTLTILSTTGAALATVAIEAGTFPPGAIVSVKWRPSPTEDPNVDNNQDDSSGGCVEGNNAFSQFGSAGTVEVTATDKNGNEITNLDNKVTVSLPVKKKSKQKAKKSCVGYRKSKKDKWNCDKSSKSNYDDNSLSWESQEFDHLTTFAIFFQFGGGFDCGNTRKFWITSLALLGALPFLLMFVVWLVLRFEWGQKLFYNFRGKRIDAVMSSVESRQSSSVVR